jgi:uncharacterized membrane protein
MRHPVPSSTHSTALPGRAVSRILLLGGAIAVMLMLTGLIGLEVRAARTAHPLDVAHVVENRMAGRAVDVFVSLPQIGRALRGWPPAPVAVIAAGVVVLLATPGVAVLAALAAFAGAGDRRYVAICAVLIVALACGFFLNLGG